MAYRRHGRLSYVSSVLLESHLASSDYASEQAECACQPDGRMEKYGPRVRTGELEALKHAQSLGVPVPIALDYIPERQTIYMEYVEGDCLESVWASMSEDEKKSIAQQLGQAISLMRSSRQTGVLIGAIRGLARDCRRYGDHTGWPVHGHTIVQYIRLGSLHSMPATYSQRSSREDADRP